MDVFQRVRATQAAAQRFKSNASAEGQTRGVTEKKRKDEKPSPQPEPPLTGRPYEYPSYQQDPYVQSQTHQPQQPAYSGSSSHYSPYQEQQTHQPSHPSQQPAYGGSSSQHPPYQSQQPLYHNQQSYYPAQNLGGYGSQTQNQGGYGAPYQGYNTASQGPQSQYGQYQQNHNYSGGQPYSPGTRDGYSSVPNSQGPYSPPPISRAATTGSYLSAPARSDSRFCSHGFDLAYDICRECPPRRYP